MAGENSQAIYAWRGAGLGMEPFIERIHAKILPSLYYVPVPT